VQAEQRRAEGEREAARLGLAAQLGRKLGAPLLLSPPPKVTAPGDAANPPSLRAAEKSVVSASAAVDLARLGLLPDPSISVNGGFSREVFEQGDFFGNNVAGAGIDRIEVREFAFSLQVSAPLPVFRDGYEGSVDAARARLAQAEAERDGVKRQNDAATQAAQAQLEAALAAEALLTTAVPRYEEVLTLTEKAYAGGALGIDALLLARTRVYTAKAELLRARAATLYARLDLAEARGEILGD
jgi:outer membrane protein TolC